MSAIDWNEEGAKVSEIASKLSFLRQTLERQEKELKECDGDIIHAQEAQDIVQHIGQAVQQRVHDQIAEVISSCLSSVFEDEAYEFKIVFERKRGKTEASLRFLRGDLDVDPLTASGGGVVDVAAFALRVACLMLKRPKLSKLVVLDEPFRFVSVQYQDKVRLMLEEMSKELKLQIIMVTHNENLATGSIVEI